MVLAGVRAPEETSRAEERAGRDARVHLPAPPRGVALPPQPAAPRAELRGDGDAHETGGPRLKKGS